SCGTRPGRTGRTADTSGGRSDEPLERDRLDARPGAGEACPRCDRPGYPWVKGKLAADSFAEFPATRTTGLACPILPSCADLALVRMLAEGARERSLRRLTSISRSAALDRPASRDLPLREFRRRIEHVGAGRAVVAGSRMPPNGVASRVPIALFGRGRELAGIGFGGLSRGDCEGCHDRRSREHLDHRTSPFCNSSWDDAMGDNPHRAPSAGSTLCVLWVCRLRQEAAIATERDFRAGQWLGCA